MTVIDPPQRGVRKAVALAWDRRRAPHIAAAGSGHVAEEILRIAAAHDVPLHRDPVLAEALAQIPLGDEIPSELYLAVAEVLAFVFAVAGIDPRIPTHGTGDHDHEPSAAR